MKNPLISIIIPVYNGSNYVSQAIDSALAQTYKNIEIIVVNDGSRDDGATEKTVLSYGDKVRYFKKENGGVSTALNFGIEKMNGDYFSWLSHDDLYVPEKIEIQINMLTEQNKDCALMCGTSFVDENSSPIERRQKYINDGFYKNTEMLSNIFSGYYISGCALLIPKSAFEKCGLFDEKLRYMQDMEMWYRMMINGTDFYHTNKVGVLSRVHSMQTTTTAKHLGPADADKVGAYMVDNLQGLNNSNGENLLKKYMLLCYRNQSLKSGNRALDILKKNGEINSGEILRAKCMNVYGK